MLSIAVLCDDSEAFHPTEFTTGDLWGCRARLDFLTIKLREYNKQWGDLEAESNPFATVIMAHLKTQATRHKPESRYTWKLQLIRRLYDKGYGKEDVIELFRFIDWVMALPAELETRLTHDIATFETERNMPYVSGIERRAIERGLQKGLKQGIEQGRKVGFREAETTMLREMMADFLTSDIPPSVDQRIAEANSKQLRAWIKQVPRAKCLEDIFGSSD